MEIAIEENAIKKVSSSANDLALLKRLEELSFRLEATCRDLKSSNFILLSDPKIDKLLLCIVIITGFSLILFRFDLEFIPNSVLFIIITSVVFLVSEKVYSKNYNSWESDKLLREIESVKSFLRETLEPQQLQQFRQQPVQQLLPVSAPVPLSPSSLVTGIRSTSSADSRIIQTEDLIAPMRQARTNSAQDWDLVDKSGYRLNFFANLDNLDFDRDVFSSLPSEKQSIFLRFHDKFFQAFEPQATENSNTPDKFTLLRFLQADKYDVDKAVHRMLQTIRWWKETQVDEFIDLPNWKLVSRGKMLRPRIFCCYDKHHCPLFFEKLGEFFGSDEAYKGLSLSDWVAFYKFEASEVTNSFRDGFKKFGKYQHSMSYVGDLSGLRLMQCIKLLPLLKTLVKEVETHYPEIAGHIVLMNAPHFVSRLFQIGKKFLDPTLLEKIQVVSHDARQILIDTFGEEAVPTQYGGKNPIFIPGPPKRISDGGTGAVTGWSCCTDS